MKEENKGLDHIEQTKSPEKLPSRTEIHANKRKNTKWKVKFPVVRLIGFAFLLIPISILAIHFNDKESAIFEKFFTPAVGAYDQISIPKQAEAKPADNHKEKNKDAAADQKSQTEKENKNEDSSDTTGAYGNEKSNVINTTTKTSANDAAESNSASETQEDAVDEENEIEEEKIEEQIEYVEHIVQESETLYRISMKYYNSRAGEKIISDHNGLINNQVNVGQKLQIPLKP